MGRYLPVSPIYAHRKAILQGIQGIWGIWGDIQGYIADMPCIRPSTTSDPVLPPQRPILAILGGRGRPYGVNRGISQQNRQRNTQIWQIAILRDNDPWPGGWIPCPSRWERVGVANMPSNTLIMAIYTGNTVNMGIQGSVPAKPRISLGKSLNHP